MQFGEAIEELRAGKRVARGDKWDVQRWIQLCKPIFEDIDEPANLAFVLVKRGEFSQAGWMPTNCDMVATDWVVIDDA